MNPADATPTAERPAITLTVPAEHVEHVRAGVIREIVEDAERLRHVVSLDIDSSIKADDVASTLRNLQADLRLVPQIIDVDGIIDVEGDTQVSADAETLSEALQATMRNVIAAMSEHTQYAPLDLDTLRPLSAALAWTIETIEAVLSKEARR